MPFLCDIYTNIYTEISNQQLERKYKALQRIAIKHFVFLCLSPSQKTMVSILGNAFSSILKEHNFKFFLLNRLPMVDDDCNMDYCLRHFIALI